MSGAAHTAGGRKREVVEGGLMRFTNAEKDAIALVAEEEAERDVPRRVFPIAGRHCEVLRMLAPKQVSEVLDYAYGDSGKARGVAKIDGGYIPLAEGLREGRDVYEGWLKYILGDERYKTLCNMDAEVAFLENPATQAQRFIEEGVLFAYGGSAYAVRDRLRNIPAGVLPASQRHVLLDMATHTNRETGECFPSIDTLAQDTGQSERHVKRSISNMCAAGILKVGKRKTSRGNGNVYSITLPKAPKEIKESASAIGDHMSPIKEPKDPIGDTSEHQRVTFASAIGDCMSPERIKKEIKENGGDARARVRTPAAAASSSDSGEDEEERIITEMARYLGDITPNHPEWKKGIRRLGPRGFKYLGERAKQEAKTNPGALLTLMLNSVDGEALKKKLDEIDAEVRRKHESLFITCRYYGCENYTVEPDREGSHCKARYKPLSENANCSRCPHYKKSEAAQAESEVNAVAAAGRRSAADEAWAGSDGELCRERCANARHNGCAAGIDTPPSANAERPHTPEECPRYKALQQETNDGRAA